MKTGIHPAYYPKAKIKCACGNTFTVGATRETMTVEICSHCHPFYTGTEKLLDIAGRVEKFRTRQEKAKQTVLKKKSKPASRKTRTAASIKKSVVKKPLKKK